MIINLCIRIGEKDFKPVLAGKFVHFAVETFRSEIKHMFVFHQINFRPVDRFPLRAGKNEIVQDGGILPFSGINRTVDFRRVSAEFDNLDRWGGECAKRQYAGYQNKQQFPFHL